MVSMGRIFSYLFRAFFIFSILMILYIIFLVWQLPLDKLDKSKYRDQVTLNPIELEEGAIVNLNELYAFNLFSSTGDTFKSWIEKEFKKGTIEKIASNRELVVLNENLKIENLLRNDCPNIYCYQHRVKFGQIPSVFWKGLIGIEDYRFLNHFGIDFKSIARALLTDIIEMKIVQGGSTLTQQLVKNLFLTNKKTFIRKIKEMILSIYIESKFQKRDILEFYFNEVFWGVLEGIKLKGVYAASLFYFGKKPKDITLYEASILISLLKGPNYYNPLIYLNKLIGRANNVYKRLVKLNLYPKDQVRPWSNLQWEDWKKQLYNRNKLRRFHAVWRSLRDKSEILNNYEKYVFTVKALSILRATQKKVGDNDLAVKAMIGNPFDSKKVYTFYSKVERALNVAYSEERHLVGSILKPIVYSVILNHGKKLKDLVKTQKITLNLKSGEWSPREVHQNLKEEVTILEALLRSYNRPLIHLAKEVGFESVEKELLQYIPHLKTPLSEYPAQLLGASELSLREIYNIYLKFIKKECQKQENIILSLSNPKLTTVRRSITQHIGQMRFFGKTGTSNNGWDNWYIFFNGRILGAIWFGKEGRRGDQDIGLYGSTTSFQIFQYFVRDRGKRFNELICDRMISADSVP